MGNNYNEDGIRNLLYAIALSAYDDLVAACKAVLKAQKQGDKGKLKEALAWRKNAAEWFDGIEWKDKAIRAAENQALNGKPKGKRFRKPRIGSKKKQMEQMKR